MWNFFQWESHQRFLGKPSKSCSRESRPEEAESGKHLTRSVFSCFFNGYSLQQHCQSVSCFSSCRGSAGKSWQSCRGLTLYPLLLHSVWPYWVPLVSHCLYAFLFCPLVLCHKVWELWPGQELRSAIGGLFMFCSVCVKMITFHVWYVLVSNKSYIMLSLKSFMNYTCIILYVL